MLLCLLIPFFCYYVTLFSTLLLLLCLQFPLSYSVFFPHRRHPQAGEGEGPVEHEEFVAEAVVCGGLHDGVDYARIHQKILAESLAGEMAV